MLEQGVRFDFQYISDSLWSLKSEKPERFASWNRIRWTVDIDFGALTGQRGLYFHATALWQAGSNLGRYLGLLTGPSGLVSANTCRLDSWWLEKRWLNERVVARVGQFAEQDFYGADHYAASYIFEPMGYALGNLFTDLETFDPPSTPAIEVRVAPLDHIYVKSMVATSVSEPFSINPTGLVPQFRGVPVSVYEIGFTSGQKASAIRAFDKASAVSSEGEQHHPRNWNFYFIGLPVIDEKKQRKPSFTATEVEQILAKAKGRYKVLFALLAGTGLRIGEAFGLRLGEHLSGDFSTIKVRQSVWRGSVQAPKTDNAVREIDVPSSLAAFLKASVGGKTSGFLFRRSRADRWHSATFCETASTRFAGT